MINATDGHNRMMTTKEVSLEFGIPVGTLRYYRSSDIGPASFLLQGRVRYRRADILQWIDNEERATKRGGISAGYRASASV